MSGEFRKIDTEDIYLLNQFLSNAGESLNGFRYYESRPFSVIKDHLCTYLYIDNDIPLSYGHLDVEDNIVWLGICVSEGAKGKGLGSIMIENLINEAKLKSIQRIHLAVDRNNLPAIQLYRKYGFVIQKIGDKNQFMILDLSHDE